MNAMKHLTEEQQAAVYKKLCEAALRVYANNDELQSADDWKNIFDSIISITGIKVRKVSKGFRLISDIYCEYVNMNTSNSSLQDTITSMISSINDGTEQGYKRIKRIYNFISIIYTL